MDKNTCHPNLTPKFYPWSAQKYFQKEATNTHTKPKSLPYNPTIPLLDTYPIEIKIRVGTKIHIVEPKRFCYSLLRGVFATQGWRAMVSVTRCCCPGLRFGSSTHIRHLQLLSQFRDIHCPLASVVTDLHAHAHINSCTHTEIKIKIFKKCLMLFQSSVLSGHCRQFITAYNSSSRDRCVLWLPWAKNMSNGSGK